jgi:uncharacterized cofD-like protein
MKFLDRLYKWLLPGMKIKRWIFLSWVGLAIFSVGLILLVKIGFLISIENFLADILERLLNRPVDSFWIDILLISSGLLLFFIGLRQWFISIYRVVVPNEEKSLVDVIYEKRHLDHGLRIAALGGGTGLSSLLRGLKSHTSNITAIVTVADDGGSSGRLRKEMGVLPPGDIRNCLVALADQESLMGELFQYRFTDGESLEGHSFGNLFLVAMTAVAGDFEQAIRLSGKILAIKGKVIPSTLCPVTLCAVTKSGKIVEGESSITHDREKIDRVYLKPAACQPPQEVLDALASADIIVMGPGSLYTSVLPNLLVEGVAGAVNASKALTIYICNVMTQPGETDAFTASEHLKALKKSVPGLRIDCCMVNDQIPPASLLERYREEEKTPVAADMEKIEEMGIRCVAAPLISTADLVRHDPDLLADRIVRLASEMRGQRQEAQA